MPSINRRRGAPQFGVRVITYGADNPIRWRQIADQARAAEQAGADRIIVSGDHVVFGEHLEAYGRPELGGRLGGTVDLGPDAVIPDPIVAMTVVCSVTERVRVMNSLMLAALRRPIVLAKAMASLDTVSGGRVDLSVGIGWQREEYAAAGLEFERRGRLLDHTLEVCQTLWREPRATYSSPELSFEAIHMQPKPLQRDGVPLWISGSVNPGAMRRLARFGTGWNPWGAAQDDVVAAIPRMREAVASFGRDPSEIEIQASLPLVADADGRPLADPSMEHLLPLVEAGVTNVDVVLPIPPDYQAAVDHLTPWVELFKQATR